MSRSAEPRPRTNKCATHAHPEPSMDEREQMHASLRGAIAALDETFSLANGTPPYHYLTDHLGEAIALLSRLGRTI